MRQMQRRRRPVARLQETRQRRAQMPLRIPWRRLHIRVRGLIECNQVIIFVQDHSWRHDRIAVDAIGRALHNDRGIGRQPQLRVTNTNAVHPHTAARDQPRRLRFIAECSSERVAQRCAWKRCEHRSFHTVTL